MILLPFVEQDRESLLADQPRQPVGRGDVAGRQRGERRRIERLEVSDRRDLLAVLVDEKHDVGAGVLTQPLQDRLDSLELVAVEEEVGRRHRISGFFRWR